MINRWDSFNQINENLAKARSILKASDVPETDKNFIELRKMLSRNMGYLGKFTEWHFKDKVGLEQLSNLYNRIRNTRLSKSIDQFKSPEEIIDTIVRTSSEEAVNQMVGSIPSRTRDFLKSSDSCVCGGDGVVECEKCYGESVIDCSKCEGEGCKNCDAGQIDCKKCDGGYIECKKCKDGSKEWIEFKQFLSLHKDSKDIIIDFFSKKGGRYGDEYDIDEVFYFLKRDIELLINIPDIDSIKDSAINSPIVKYKETSYNYKKRKNEIVIKETKGISLIYDDDKYLIIASNWAGLQKYGSSYWCITEDKDTFDDYVYNGYCVQLILYIKGKKPLIDDKSVIGITYDINSGEITAAHWEDDRDAIRESTSIFKTIEIDKKNIIKSLDIYDYSDEQMDQLMIKYPSEFSADIESIIQNEIDESKKSSRKNAIKSGMIDDLIMKYFESNNNKSDNKFIEIIKNYLKKKDFKYTSYNIESVIYCDMMEYVVFDKNWLNINCFSLFNEYCDDDKDSDAILNTLKVFKKNGYDFSKYIKNATSYIPLLIIHNIVKIPDVYKNIYYDILEKNTYKKVKKKIFEWVLNNDFDFISTSGNTSLYFINYIIDNNLVDKYKSKIIDKLNEYKFDIKTINYILDKIDDDDIDVAAGRRLLHQKLHKKYKIDFKKFESLKFKEFSINDKNHFQELLEVFNTIKDIFYELDDHNVTYEIKPDNEIGIKMLSLKQKGLLDDDSKDFYININTHNLTDKDKRSGTLQLPEWFKEIIYRMEDYMTSFGYKMVISVRLPGKWVVMDIDELFKFHGLAFIIRLRFI